MCDFPIIPTNGDPGLVLLTVYVTPFISDSHVMVVVFMVLELNTCVRFEGAAGGSREFVQDEYIYVANGQTS